MYKVIFLVSVTILLIACPLGSLANGPSVCGFYGNASIEGEVVPDGTTVKAWIDGKQVESVKTAISIEGNSSYNYKINISGEFDGKTIVFTVGSLDLQAGTAIWTSGGRDRLNLNGLESQSQQIILASSPSIVMIPTEGLVTRIEGQGYSPGSKLTVTIGGKPAGETKVAINGEFEIVVTAPIQTAGTYDVIVADDGGKSQQTTLTVPDLQGAAGIQGEPGVAGSMGPKGDSGGTTFGIVAMILSVVAVFVSGIVGIKFMDFMKKQQ